MLSVFEQKVNKQPTIHQKGTGRDFSLGKFAQKHYSFVPDSAIVHENIFSTGLNS